jgi:hypothetical protein
MNAWHDSLSGSTSSSSSGGDNMLIDARTIVQLSTFIVNEGSFADLHAEI